MVNQRFCLIVLILIVFGILFGIVVFANDNTTKMTTCRLASQILGKDQRVCVFVGANNTQYREYLPYDAGECPRQYQCPYRPNEKPFDIKAVIKNIKEQFTD
jgi:hypothetical protein